MNLKRRSAESRKRGACNPCATGGRDPEDLATHGLQSSFTTSRWWPTTEQRRLSLVFLTECLPPMHGFGQRITFLASVSQGSHPLVEFGPDVPLRGWAVPGLHAGTVPVEVLSDLGSEPGRTGPTFPATSEGLLRCEVLIWSGSECGRAYAGTFDSPVSAGVVA